MTTGTELARHFHAEVIRPLIKDVVGDNYSAARIDGGSEVLGFDDETSQDHSWGPRLQLFLPEDSGPDLADKLDATLRQRLPSEFLGYSTSFAPDIVGDGSYVASESVASDVDHLIEIIKLSDFLSRYAGMFSVDDLSSGDWLSIPSQKLLTLSTGPVFFDGVDLRNMQSQLSFYPDDVWMYLMACQWTRFAQEEHFIGRTGMTGDELGSQLITSRLTQHAIRLAYLLERQYAPYSKWLGTAFRKLSCAESLGPLIEEVHSAKDWHQREAAFVEVASRLGEIHNDLGITEPVDTSPRQFFGRPIQYLDCERFAGALKSAAAGSSPDGLWDGRPIGGIDTFSDSTVLLEDRARRSAIANLITNS